MKHCFTFCSDPGRVNAHKALCVWWRLPVKTLKTCNQLFREYGFRLKIFLNRESMEAALNNDTWDGLSVYCFVFPKPLIRDDKTISVCVSIPWR